MDIRISHLTKRFGPQAAVQDVSFEVHTGEVLGFLGPNGAGKTTTMRMLLGVLPPDAGTITIGGIPVEQGGMALRRAVGYLPESNPLYEDMAVLDLLRFTARMQGVAAARLDERVRAMVDACGLAREKHKRIRELSKGYRQRVGLAQAMVHDPQVLILDEPTSGLDPNQMLEIRHLVQELGRTKTLIFSTHILAEVEALCDRVLIIDKGRIVADDKPERLRARGGSSGLLVRVEGAEESALRTALEQLPGSLRVTPVPPGPDTFQVGTEHPTDMARSIFRLCVERQWTLLTLQPDEERLEDVFRQLTRG